MMNISEIARGVFQSQLGSIQLHLEGCIEGADPIHLHDLRVANRRTRAALTEFKMLMPGEVFHKFQQDFRWIHRITGTVRDLDVTISHYPEFKNEIPKSWRSHLKPMRRLLAKKRDAAQIELADVLRSTRIRDILKDWQDHLDSGVIHTNGLGMEDAREYGGKSIVRRYCGIQREGETLTKKTPAAVLHEFRIEVKKLRYLMEFYRPVMDQEDFEKLRAGLKSVQDIFGEFQDTDVQAGKLHDLAVELHRDGANPETLLAIGQLMGLLESRLRKSKKRCLRQLRWLISDSVARNFQSCFLYPVD
jgi:CHAD domain-containing protein